MHKHEYLDDFDFEQLPPPLTDKEWWGKAVAVAKEMEKYQNLADGLRHVIPITPEGEAETEDRWITVEVDHCEEVSVHLSSLSEVQVEPLTGVVELILDDGNGSGPIAGLVTASGQVVVHGLLRGSTFRYRPPSG